jgi:hypothetical protein
METPMKQHALIKNAVKALEKTTGLNARFQDEYLNAAEYQDGLLQLNHENKQWIYPVEAKARLTPAAAALIKAKRADGNDQAIVVTEYVAPPMAERLKHLGLFFIDTAGNAYIEEPPLYIYIIGRKPAPKIQTKRLTHVFGPRGLKVVFALLNTPHMVNRPFREIAETAGVALGTVGGVFQDLKNMGFCLVTGKKDRHLREVQTLIRRWVEAYPEQLRPKLVIDHFEADHRNWWRDVNIRHYGACWGGEVAGARLTQYLKPENVTIYADTPPGKLILEHKLKKAENGSIEILKPFWKTDPDGLNRETAPPLIVYADLMATGDARNIETAGLIYEKYLVQLVG